MAHFFLPPNGCLEVIFNNYKHKCLWLLQSWTDGGVVSLKMKSREDGMWEVPSFSLLWTTSQFSCGGTDWFWNKFSCCFSPQDGSKGDIRAAAAAATSYEERRICGRTNPGLYHPIRRCPPGTKWRWLKKGPIDPPCLFIFPRLYHVYRILVVSQSKCVIWSLT